MLEKLCFITDLLTTIYGPLKPPLLLAKELKNRYDIEFITGMITFTDYVCMVTILLRSINMIF